MDTLTAIFLVAFIIGALLLIWSYTKSGKKWLENL